MLSKFHIDSQNALIKPAGEIKLSKGRGMVSAGDLAREYIEILRQGNEKARQSAIEGVNMRRRLIYERPSNEWGVYELCKEVYLLAEIDRVDFNGASYETKCSFIKMLVPFASPEAISDGVAEYHESRLREGWEMQWMIDDERKFKEETKDIALQFTQDLLTSFIQDKGLTAEFQAYVANFELAHDKQAR